MRSPFARGMVGVAAGLSLLLPLALLSAHAEDAQWTPPRTSWGDPDLQGHWTNRTLITLERPDALADKAYFTPEEFEAYAAAQEGADETTFGASYTAHYNLDDYGLGDAQNQQVEYLRAKIDPSRPFFGFINFGETHAPYVFKGCEGRCPDDVRARRMTWPPMEQGPTGRATAAFRFQMAAAEFLDARLPGLFDGLPGETIVVLTADHGDCFGEDGYWGHGVNHPKVLEVPLAIFRLDRKAL